MLYNKDKSQVFMTTVTYTN